MTSSPKNMAAITVLQASSSWSNLVLCQNIRLVKVDGVPELVNIPVDEVTLHGQGVAIETTEDKFKEKPPTATKNDVNVVRNKGMVSYNKDASFVQGVGRDKALAAGDVNVGIKFVLSRGFFLKQTGEKPQKKFMVVQAGIGAVDVMTKAISKKAGYIRQFGLTSAKGVVPQTLEEWLFSLEANIHVDGLKSGGIYAFREAIILPRSKSSKSGGTTISTERTATPTVTTKNKRVTFLLGSDTHYVWSDWVYVVVL